MPVYTRTYRLKNGEVRTSRFIKFDFDGQTYYPSTKGPRQHLASFIRLALHTGMRRGELLKLTWRDVDFDGAVLHVRDPKNSRDRALPINAEARTVLLQLQPSRAEDRVFAFVEMKRAWNSDCRIAEIEDLHFHDLRHTFVTRLADAFTIAALLGHTTIQMASRYTHATDQDKVQAVQNLANRCKIVATPERSNVRKMFK
jgi:integrase